jgi:catechol 2,3-dioxygenase-like lactoylglutathione lyase family enzyme
VHARSAKAHRSEAGPQGVGVVAAVDGSVVLQRRISSRRTTSVCVAVARGLTTDGNRYSDGRPMLTSSHMPGIFVNIDVPDLARAVDFYTRGFGLRVGRRFGASAVELLGTDAPIYLLLKPAGGPAFRGATAAAVPATRDYGRHWTPVHLDVVVDAIEPALVAALAAGARVESDVQTAPWGKMAVLSDPFGHGVCLLEMSERGYDAIAT